MKWRQNHRRRCASVCHYWLFIYCNFRVTRVLYAKKHKYLPKKSIQWIIWRKDQIWKLWCCILRLEFWKHCVALLLLFDRPTIFWVGKRYGVKCEGVHTSTTEHFHENTDSIKIIRQVHNILCTERIFDSRPLMYNKTFLDKLL